MPETSPLPLHLPAGAAVQALQPLRGMTLLAVEDSRFASDALRLLCQRSGARLRRAESLMLARTHLRCYRPDAVLVDLGLPDGHGTVLIRDLALRSNRPPILGMSGDAAGRGPALAAGADSFLLKPIAGLRAFQSVILRLITGRGEGLPEDEVYITAPDPLALHDDLVHAAGLLQGNRDAQRDLYVAGFVEGIARGAQDTDLATAAHAARSGGQTELAPLERLLRQRLAMPISTLLAPKGDQPCTTAQSA